MRARCTHATRASSPHRLDRPAPRRATPAAAAGRCAACPACAAPPTCDDAVLVAPEPQRRRRLADPQVAQDDSGIQVGSDRIDDQRLDRRQRQQTEHRLDGSGNARRVPQLRRVGARDTRRASAARRARSRRRIPESGTPDRAAPGRRALASDRARARRTRSGATRRRSSPARRPRRSRGDSSAGCRRRASRTACGCPSR